MTQSDKMPHTSFAPWPAFSAEEIDAASRILRSGEVNYWTGSEGELFERDFAAWTGTGYAVALVNGTVALDLALKALGIGPGDEVIVAPRTFIASVSCVVNAGAIPVFADVNRDSGNIDADTIAPMLTERTRAVICVHLAGWPCDMTRIMELADRYGLAVIEDCAQAHGARHEGRSVGSFGQVGAWSFCQDKIMTTGGEGGMVTTDDRDLWSRMWSFKDHGKNWSAMHHDRHPPGFRWVHDSFGTNWRMLEIQAAIGRIQLRRMKDWTEARTRHARLLAEVAGRFSHALRAPKPPPGDVHAYYRYYAYVRPDGLRAGWDRDRILKEMGARGVPAYQGTCSEVYLEKAFEGTDWAPLQRLPVARELGETSLAFLTHPTLTDQDIARATETFSDIMREAAQ